MKACHNIWTPAPPAAPHAGLPPKDSGNFPQNERKATLDDAQGEARREMQLRICDDSCARISDRASEFTVEGLDHSLASEPAAALLG